MLWIKNGRLVDPKSQTDRVCDICIERDSKREHPIGAET